MHRPDPFSSSTELLVLRVTAGSSLCPWRAALPQPCSTRPRAVVLWGGAEREDTALHSTSLLLLHILYLDLKAETQVGYVFSHPHFKYFVCFTQDGGF